MERSQNTPSDSFEDVAQTHVSSTHNQVTIPFTFQDGGKLNAESQWSLKHVFSGYCDNSVTDSVNVFQAFFQTVKLLVW